MAHAGSAKGLHFHGIPRKVNPNTTSKSGPHARVAPRFSLAAVEFTTAIGVDPAYRRRIRSFRLILILLCTMRSTQLFHRTYFSCKVIYLTLDPFARTLPPFASGGLMGMLRMWFFASVLCFASVAASAQQTISGSTTGGPQTPQAASIIEQSIAALTRGTPVTDVTMTGTYTVTNHAGTQTGTITMVATASGQGQSTVTLPSGTYTETRSISAGSAIMTQTGSDGVAHTITTQTAVSPNPAWFCPALVLASASSANYSSTYVGQETLNGGAVQHLALWWLPGSTRGGAGSTPQFWQQITQHDIYLDASSMLPVAMTFLLHPYSPTAPNEPFVPYRGSNFDRTAQIAFSDYQIIQGRPVALHIHGTLPTSGTATVITDIQISSVAFNTGTTVAVPSATAN